MCIILNLFVNRGNGNNFKTIISGVAIGILTIVAGLMCLLCYVPLSHDSRIFKGCHAAITIVIVSITTWTLCTLVVTFYAF